MPDPMLELRRRWFALKEREVIRQLRAINAILYIVVVVIFALIIVRSGNVALAIPTALFGIAALLNVILWRYF